MCFLLITHVNLLIKQEGQMRVHLTFLRFLMSFK